MGATIRLLDVSRSYQRGSELVQALRPTSLTVPAGAFVALMGPSGSGKSTMLHLIAGFDKPCSGSIHLDGADIAAGKAKRRIGFIFQNFRLSPLLTASENVELGLMPFQRHGKERRGIAARALDAVGLAARKTHRPAELSGGQQQRVSIARALAIEPDLILADEPTANLDRTAGDEVISLLRRISNDTACTVIVATHDPRWAQGADTLISMQDGQVLQ